MKLPNLDTGSKSDCFLVLYSKDGRATQRLGETEVIADSLDPKWVTAITVDYFFEKQQDFMVEIYDADDATNLHNLSKHDFVGRTTFTLSKVVSGKNQEFQTQLHEGPRSSGAQVKIMATETKPDHGKHIAIFRMNLRMDGNDNKFLLFNRAKGQGRYAIVFKSETKPKEKGVHVYNEVQIDTDTLCEDQDDREILV